MYKSYFRQDGIICRAARSQSEDQPAVDARRILGLHGLTAGTERVLSELGIAAVLYRIRAVGVESGHAVNHYEIHSGLAVRIENTCAIPSAHSNHRVMLPVLAPDMGIC